MNRTRPKQMLIRMSEDEYTKVKQQIAKSGMKQQEYLIKSMTNKPITNTDGLKAVIPEIKRVGNNLNQLSRRANEGNQIGKSELAKMQWELNDVWQLLRQFIQMQA